MTSKSRQDAFAIYQATVRKVLACITDAYIDFGNTNRPDLPLRVSINNGDRVRLPGRTPVWLRFTQYCRTVESLAVDLRPRSYRVRITRYYYTLETEDEQEIYSFQYHPVRDDPDPTPHLHIGPAAGRIRKATTHQHVPTGILPVEDLIWFLHNDFGTTERSPNWRGMLRRTRADFYRELV